MLTTAYVLAAVSGPSSRADSYEAFFAEYQVKQPLIFNHLFKDVKVVASHIQFDSELPFVQIADENYSAVADTQALLFTMSQAGKGKFEKSTNKFGGYVGPDCSFVVKQSKIGTSRLVADVYLPWDARQHTDYFSVYGGYYSLLKWPFMRMYVGTGPNRYFRPDPVAGGDPYIDLPGSRYTVADGSYNGTRCVVVRVESPKRDRPHNGVYYLDRSSHMVVARESVGIPQLATRRVEPIRRLVEINYGPPAPDTGLPFPTKVKGEYITPDGKRYPAEDITFTEYRRYTPTPDEVDVEKVLKIKMPDIPPRPPLPPEGQYLDVGRSGELPAVRRSGRSAWWWYAGAGVLAAVAAGLQVRRRRTPAGS